MGFKDVTKKIGTAHLVSMVLIGAITTVGVASTVYTYSRSRTRYTECISKVEKVLEIEQDISLLNDTIIRAVNGIGDTADNIDRIMSLQKRIEQEAEDVPKTFDVSKKESQDIYDAFKNVKGDYEASIIELQAAAEEYANVALVKKEEIIAELTETISAEVIAEAQASAGETPNFDLSTPEGQKAAQEAQIAKVKAEAELQAKIQQQVTDEYSLKVREAQQNQVDKLSKYIETKESVLAIADDAVETSKKHKDDSQRILSLNALVFSIFIAVCGIADIIAVYALSKKERENKKRIAEGIAEVAQAKDKVAQAKDKVRQIATSDLITELPNRYAFYDFIENSKDSSSREVVGIGMIKVQNTEIIADTYGYDFFDNFLMMFADKLTKKFSDRCKFFYVNESTFIFLVNHVANNGIDPVFQNLLWQEVGKMIIVNNVQIVPTVRVTTGTFTKNNLSGDYIIKALTDNIKSGINTL